MAFWKPGTKGPGDGATIDRESENEGGELCVYNPNARLSLTQQRVNLPIYKHRNELLYLVEKYRVVIVVGHTGSGKTTQIPQYLLEAGWAAGGRCIACTQPRRVAAAGVASRVADERGVLLGHAEVGYAIRFDECCHPTETRIKFMTDGMLVRETMLDPLLTAYSVIMIDEAHERSLYTDVLLGLLKKIQKKRKDLRLIVSSATLDAEEFFRYFNDNDSGPGASENDTAALISLSGKSFPVEVHYLEQPTANYVQCTVSTILDIHRNMTRGDVLVFMTGQEEIEAVCAMTQEQAEQLVWDETEERRTGRRRPSLLVVPMFAGLSIEQQMQVFEPTPPNTRKVVVSTNISETSVTIPGVVYVVDCGFVKHKVYDSQSGLEALVVAPASQSSANQRSGRAGRVAPGKSYRLYTEDQFYQLPKSNPPEMQRSNLATVVMQLKALGIDDVLHFPFMSPPPAINMMRALELLYALGVLNDDAKLTTPIGATLAEFPVDPCLGKMLFVSGELGCSEEILTIAAMLTVPSVYVLPKEYRSGMDRIRRLFGVLEGDHLTLLNVYSSFIEAKQDKKWCAKYHVNHRSLSRAVQVRSQLAKYLKRWNVPRVSCSSDTTAIRKCIIHGYFANAAQLQPDGSYATIRGSHIHPNSTLFRHPPQWVVFHEVIRTAQDYMREVIAIEPQWLSEIAPHYYQLRQSSSSSSSAASTATTSTAAAAAATSASTFGSSSSLRR